MENADAKLSRLAGEKSALDVKCSRLETENQLLRDDLARTINDLREVNARVAAILNQVRGS